MKAVIVFSGTGPILILTSYPSIDDPKLIGKLKAKGINKFVSFEVPIDQCKALYCKCYDLIEDLEKGEEEIVVLDVDGVHILRNFSLKTSTPFVFEE